MYRYKVARANNRSCEWYSIRDIMAQPQSMQNKRNIPAAKLKVDDFLASHMSSSEQLTSAFGLSIISDPIGNSECMFAAISYQLQTLHNIH